MPTGFDIIAVRRRRRVTTDRRTMHPIAMTRRTPATTEHMMTTVSRLNPDELRCPVSTLRVLVLFEEEEFNRESSIPACLSPILRHLADGGREQPLLAGFLRLSDLRPLFSLLYYCSTGSP